MVINYCFNIVSAKLSVLRYENIHCASKKYNSTTKIWILGKFLFGIGEKQGTEWGKLIYANSNLIFSSLNLGNVKYRV